MARDLTELLSRAPVIPVLTIERLADAVPLARALVAGGLPVLEITLRTPVALDAAIRIAAKVPDAIVGLGTVTQVPDIRTALAAGARFLVSPGTPPELATPSCGPLCRSCPAAPPCRRRWRSPRSASPR
jgi:2-dehydro-3-deoxyphosphogluconate aldolase / (4S)-4-hydroxy-2-oxoglutarate aldolase